MAKDKGTKIEDADLQTRVAHTFSKVAEELGLDAQAAMKGEPGVGRWFVRLGNRAVQLQFADAASLAKIEDEMRWAFGVLTQK